MLLSACVCERVNLRVCACVRVCVYVRVCVSVFVSLLAAIPYFANLSMVPRRTMAPFPKGLILEAMSMPGLGFAVLC